MEKLSLSALARSQLKRAQSSTSGRSATTVFGGHEHAMRQTVIAICAGRELAEHANTGEATIHVLQGRVRLIAGAVTWDGSPGDLLIVPKELHSLAALADSVVLLTFCTSTQQSPRAA